MRGNLISGVIRMYPSYDNVDIKKIVKTQGQTAVNKAMATVTTDSLWSKGVTQEEANVLTSVLRKLRGLT